MKTTSSTPLIVNFSEIDKKGVALVGGKGANLGEMVQAGFPVPGGFIVTAEAYYQFLTANKLRPKIKNLVQDLDSSDSTKLNQVSAEVEQLILDATMPEDLENEIIKYYQALDASGQALVAARSSATAEDLPDASFAGQQETYLNVKGQTELLKKVKACWASLFEPRAIFYREEKGFDHFKVGIAVPVQKMIQADVSGIMFTINPVSNDKNQVVIEAIYGLGEKIVQGAYTPDHYLVEKLSWKILQKKIAQQKKYLTYQKGKNKELVLPKTKQKKVKLTDEQILDLAKIGHRLQQHYRFPQDIEWALADDKLYIVQSRPVTTIKAEDFETEEIKQVPKNLPLILSGDAASPGVVTGKAKILKSAKEINQLKTGEILITKMTTPDFVPAMKKAGAIITNEGGQTSHAAIVSRELGIPCIVGTETAAQDLKNGQIITVDGKTGQVFKGGQLPSEEEAQAKAEEETQQKADKISYRQLKPKVKQTQTNVYVNLGEPDLAETVAQRYADGVGLLRAEFMIADMGVHPRKMIADGKKKDFIDGLAAGLTKFAKAFSPRPVVYRATDFKTNEYANLEGGAEFENEEPNPMLGFRGASRYIENADVFEMELKAIRQVRDQAGFKNLWLMLPFVRTVEQLEKTKHLVVDAGLRRSKTFKLWMMVEIPSNIVNLERFIKVGIDGISIGSNDLTMLMLGVDRDNSQVANVYNELDDAVLWALKKAVTTAKKHGLTASICGQAPSMYPSLSKKLVEWGITSVSVTPDMIEKTRDVIYQVEHQLANQQKGKSWLNNLKKAFGA